MPFDLFSTRRRLRMTAGQPDVFEYDTIPETLRVQMAQIFARAVGEERNSSSSIGPDSNYAWSRINRILCEEYGQFKLVDRQQSSPKSDVIEFLVKTSTNEQALDVIELCCFTIVRYIGQFHKQAREHVGIYLSPDHAIEDVNHRLRRAGLGYEFVGEELIQKSDEFTHTEIMRPALAILQDPCLSGARDEFSVALRHWREGNAKDAIVNAHKAFESTMKSICEAKQIGVESTATSSKLIDSILDADLLPRHLQTHFNGLQAVLKAGVPTIRNKEASHGQGAKAVDTPSYLVEYVLHIAASSILMLATAAGLSRQSR